MTDEIGKQLDILLPIKGMTCAACVMHVEHALQETPGVLAATVNLATERAAVSLQPGPVPLESLHHSITDAGYDIDTTDTTLNVGGMTCAACVMHVEHALRDVPGVMEASVNLATERARVSYVSGLARSTWPVCPGRTAATGWRQWKGTSWTRRPNWNGWPELKRSGTSATAAHLP